MSARTTSGKAKDTRSLADGKQPTRKASQKAVDKRRVRFDSAMEAAAAPGSSPEARLTAVVTFIDAKLDSMKLAPMTWGDAETIEVVALQLTAVRALACGISPEINGRPGYFDMVWRRFGMGNYLAAGNLRIKAAEETARVVSRYVANERKRARGNGGGS